MTVDCGPLAEWTFDMPRDGAIIFRDLVGKLDTIRVECEKVAVRFVPPRSAEFQLWP
jgi:hypothetical protein